MATSIAATETTFERITRLLGLYVLAPLLVLAALPMAVHILQKPDLGMTVHRLHVHSIVDGGPAAVAGVLEGDHVLSLNGNDVQSTVEWHTLGAGDYSLDPRVLTLKRGEETITVTVIPHRPGRADMIFDLSTWLAGLLFLMIGWWVLSRRRDAVGRNFFALCLIFAFFLSDVVELPSAGYQEMKQLVRELLQYLWPVYFLRFFRMFPASGAVSSNRTDRLLLVPATVLIILTILAHLMNIDEGGTAATLLHALALAHFMAFFVVGLLVFARKVLRRDRPILHTKLRVILLGLLSGLVPFLFAVAVSGGSVPAFPNWQYLGFSLLLVPASFGLAIMRYGALDTAFVVRVSLIYGLLTALIIAAYMVGVGVLGSLLTRTYQVSAYPVVVVIIGASSLAVLPLRRQVQTWVDKAFYPSRQAGREAITRLGLDLADQDTAEAAHALLLKRLHALYRPRFLTLYLASQDGSDDLQPDSWLPADHPRGADLAHDDSVLVFLDRLRRPVFQEEYDDWAARTFGPLASTELSLDVHLMIPLTTGNRLSGMLAFGAKTSNALYSQEDLANLANLSLQIAPLLQSLRLHAESLRRRQLETELAVARDIQAGLLPTEALGLDGIRAFGRNDPCREVGGDYFDYFALNGDDRLGFCIADVAGKGIPAALLMTTMRVAFRELARPGVEPEEVIGKLDRRLGEILSPGRFVCFFYGVYDRKEGLLSYCNAGLEPPVLLHADGTYESLRRGGPILGIGAGVPYRRGTVRPRPGDLLLGYTDGITEQTSPDGQEFFEFERLLALATERRSRPGEEICREIFNKVDEFGGDEISDDRTIIALSFGPTQEPAQEPEAIQPTTPPSGT